MEQVSVSGSETTILAGDPEENVIELSRQLAEYREWVDRITKVCEEAARGNLEPRLLGCTDSSPMARLGRAVNRMLDVTDAFVRESGAALEHASQEKFFRRVILRGMPGSFRQASLLINAATEQMAGKSKALKDSEVRRLKLADEFETSVQSVIQTVVSSAGHMKGTAQSLSGSAAESSDRVNAVASASEETSANVRSVAAAVEELTSSVGEITRQVSESAEVATQAVGEAQKTNTIVLELSEASARIGNVAKVISKIAGTTNLLALNATIEAARAGEAGKGFAVVASEVKELANQTARATEEITTEIEAVQGKTKEAVKAIGLIADTIKRIDSISGTISTSVGEQRAATGEISSNIQQTAIATQEVSQNISGVTVAVQQTSASAGELLGAADGLRSEAEKLRTVASSFVEIIRRG